MAHYAQFTRSIVVALFLWVTIAILHVRVVSAHTDSELPYESKFIDARGVRLHYLDFGGEGLAMVFVHSESRDAFTYTKFAPRFSHAYRVLAVTRPGYGQSEDPGYGFDVSTQAESLIDFLDALGIEQAIFAGNSAPSSEMTYLAEHHVDRVAGLIYLAGPPSFGSEDTVAADPTEAGPMVDRAWYDLHERDRRSARRGYLPDYLRSSQPTIHVPALVFVDRVGAGHGWGVSIALVLVGSPFVADVLRDPTFSIQPANYRRLLTDKAFRHDQLNLIPDSDARAYFHRLAEDSDLQADVHRYHNEVILPSILASQNKFKQAFGNNVDVVQLDVALVTGYAYRDSPELIVPHIQLFLSRIKGQDGRE